MQCLWRCWQPCILLASPTSARTDFNSQPKLVLIYRPRKGERLSWPEQMWVNNLLKVITRQPSDTTGIQTWATRSWKRCANHSATAPHHMCRIPSRNSWLWPTTNTVQKQVPTASFQCAPNQSRIAAAILTNHNRVSLNSPLSWL